MALTPVPLAPAAARLNINCGVMGHVDSGKTSLVRALSTEISTAALDKSPQSVSRGITLDLGFSAFSVPAPPAVSAAGYVTLQFTLVDMPGHASLIRTIIGGAQIIDLMLLVIDVTRGIQTQTAECLVVGEITTNTLIVVLNKLDLLPPEPERSTRLAAITAKIRKVLASTKFAAAPFVAVSAVAPSDPGTAAPGAVAESGGAQRPPGDVTPLIAAMSAAVRVPRRDGTGPFLFAVDHAFLIKGQGTVLTGTVLSGSASINDTLALPMLGVERKVKSMQMFKVPAQRITQGDRAGVCVTNLDAASVERGILATPGTVPTLHAAIALVRKVRFFRGKCASESKFHVSVGHATVMATAVFFGAAEVDQRLQQLRQREPLALASSHSAVGSSSTAVAAAVRDDSPDISYDWNAEFIWQPELMLSSGSSDRQTDATSSAAPSSAIPPATATPTRYEWQWAALLFETPVVCPLSALVIGSHLDADLTANSCRLAFHGRLAAALPSSDVHELRKCNLFKPKERKGVVDRLDAASASDSSSSVTAIVRGLFKSGTDMNEVIGLRVTSQTGRAGVIESSFGKSGKVKVAFAAAAATTATTTNNPSIIKAGDAVFLRYRKFLFAPPNAAAVSGAAAGSGSAAPGPRRHSSKFVQ